MFQCDWVSLIEGKGIKKDAFGFTLVNFSQLIHKGNNIRDEPFIFASQAKQVFYIQDPLNENWKIVVNAISRVVYDLGAEPVEECIGKSSFYSSCSFTFQISVFNFGLQNQ